MKSMPFSRAISAMAAIAAAAMSLPNGQQQAQLAAIGPYESRGKGGKRPHRSVGTKVFQRAALKRRNKKARHV